MSIELISAIAAVMIIWLIFTWLIKVFKVSITTVLTVGAIIVSWQIVFGIKPEQIWSIINNIMAQIEQFIWQYL